MNRIFEDYQIIKNDMMCRAAFELACAIVQKDPDSDNVPLSWSVSFIREIVDAAYDILQRKGMSVCDPFYSGESGEIPCYQCGECNTPDCPFNKAEKKGEKKDNDK